MIRPQVQYLVFITFVTFFSSCGKSNVSENRAPIVSGIIHGERADETKYSFVATLLKDQSQVCSATLISKEFALTSAHCVLEAESDYEISVGRNLLKVEEIIPHPKFDFEIDNYTDYDIALLRFKESDVDYIEIANKVLSKRLTVLGLGYTEEDVLGQLYKKQVRVKTQSKYCGHNFGETTIITDKALFGADSGGALTQNDELVGVNSAYKYTNNFFKGLYCNRSFYTDVTILKDWIEKYI